MMTPAPRQWLALLCLATGVAAGTLLGRHWRQQTPDEIILTTPTGPRPARLEKQATPPDIALRLAQMVSRSGLESHRGRILSEIDKEFGEAWSDDYAQQWAEQNPAEFATWLLTGDGKKLPDKKALAYAEILISQWALTEPIAAWKTMNLLGAERDPAWLHDVRSTVVSNILQQAPKSLLDIVPLLEGGEDIHFTSYTDGIPTEATLSTLEQLKLGRLRHEFLQSIASNWNSYTKSESEAMGYLAWWRSLPPSDSKLLDLNDLSSVLDHLEPQELNALRNATKYSQSNIAFWLSEQLKEATPKQVAGFKENFAPETFLDAVRFSVGEAIETGQWDTAMTLSQHLGSSQKQGRVILDQLVDDLPAKDVAAWLQQPAVPVEWKRYGMEKIVDQWIQKSPEEFLAWSASAPPEWVTDDFLTKASKSLSEQSPDHWDRWRKTALDPHTKGNEILQESLCSIARRDGPKAINLMERLPSEAQAELFPDLIQTWHGSDHQGLMRWLLTQPAKRQQSAHSVIRLLTD